MDSLPENKNKEIGWGFLFFFFFVGSFLFGFIYYVFNGFVRNSDGGGEMFHTIFFSQMCTYIRKPECKVYSWCKFKMLLLPLFRNSETAVFLILIS